MPPPLELELDGDVDEPPLEDPAPEPKPEEEGDEEEDPVFDEPDEPPLDEDEDEDDPPDEPVFVEDDPGVVAVSGVVGVVAPGAVTPFEGVDTVITGVEAELGLGEDALERPIRTPTPIASSNTPTPAMRVTAPERPAPTPEAAPGASGGAGGAWEAVASPTAGGPPSGTPLIGARRSPHSRQ